MVPRIPVARDAALRSACVACTALGEGGRYFLSRKSLLPVPAQVIKIRPKAGPLSKEKRSAVLTLEPESVGRPFLKGMRGHDNAQIIRDCPEALVKGPVRIWREGETVAWIVVPGIRKGRNMRSLNDGRSRRGHGKGVPSQCASVAVFRDQPRVDPRKPLGSRGSAGRRRAQCGINLGP